MHRSIDLFPSSRRERVGVDSLAIATIPNTVTRLGILTRLKFRGTINTTSPNVVDDEETYDKRLVFAGEDVASRRRISALAAQKYSDVRAKKHHQFSLFSIKLAICLPVIRTPSLYAWRLQVKTRHVSLQIFNVVKINTNICERGGGDGARALCYVQCVYNIYPPSPRGRTRESMTDSHRDRARLVGNGLWIRSPSDEDGLLGRVAGGPISARWQPRLSI